MRRFALFALAGVFTVLAAGSDARPNRPPVVGSQIGYYEISQGAAWVDLQADDFTAANGRTLTAGDAFVTLFIRNTHATQDLRVLFTASGATPVGEGALIPPGEWMSFDLYGQAVTTIAIAGSGAATTGNAVAYFISGTY